MESVGALTNLEDRIFRIFIKHAKTEGFLLFSLAGGTLLV